MSGVDGASAVNMRLLLAEWAGEDAFYAELFGLESEDLRAEPEPAAFTPPAWTRIMGGPPTAWDAWVLALPDDEFADLLGPTDTEDRWRIPRQRPSTAKPVHLSGSWAAFG
jgi:hypothetical protein